MSRPLSLHTSRAGDFIFVSGQGGMVDGALVPGGVTAETAQTVANLGGSAWPSWVPAHRRGQDHLFLDPDDGHTFHL